VSRRSLHAAALLTLVGVPFGLSAGCGEGSACEGAACGGGDAAIVPEIPVDARPDSSLEQEGGGPPPDGSPPERTVVEYEATCGSDEMYWPEEQDEVHWTVRCSSALAEAVGLPDGASFDPASGRISWTPRLDQAGPFEIVVTGADGGLTRIAGNVLDRFDAPGNVPVIDPVRYLEEHGLPVIHLSWHSDEPKYCKDAVARDPVPADIVVGGGAHAGAELRCRGATSLAFPKKSFTLRFTKDAPFHPPPSLAAFEGRRRLVLTQTFDDNSQIRTRMGFETWNRLDPANVRIDHASVVVFVDGVYQGLYQLTDNVGDHLMAVRGLDKDGNIFKSESHAGNYRTSYNNGKPKTDLKVGYEKSDGEPEDDFGDLETLLRWVSSSSIAEIDGTIDTMLRTEDFLDWYILTTTLLAYDNYGKNSNVYRDSDGPDTRFRYIPWDLNATWGQSWDMQRILPTAAGKDSPVPLTNNGIWERIAESPTLRARLDARFAAALAGPMSLAETLALFDRMSAEVRLSALRDDRRWDAERRVYPLWSSRKDFTTFDTERAYLRSWIEQRWAYLTPLYVDPSETPSSPTLPSSGVGYVTGHPEAPSGAF
jgi:spore coat protein H